MNGKKFNIWIAYSDLFTNLSTFLFISALGVLAMLGSGSYRPTDTALAGCDSQGIDAVLTKGLERGSAIQSLKVPPAADLPCRRYYVISPYRFTSKSNSIQALKGPGDAEWDRVELFARICVPLWKLASQETFSEQNGQILIRGVGKSANDWPGQPVCPAVTSPETPDLSHWSGMSTIEAIHTCEGGGEAGAICEDVRLCKAGGSQAQARPCRQIDMLRTWSKSVSRQCLLQVAQAQARTLAAFCGEAPTAWKHFPEEIFFADGAAREARWPETRASLWVRVTEGGFAEGLGAPISPGAEAKSALEQVGAGGLVIEVRLDPARKKQIDGNIAAGAPSPSRSE